MNTELSGFDIKNLIGKKGEFLFERLYASHKCDVYELSRNEWTGWIDKTNDQKARAEDCDFYWYRNGELTQKIEVKYDTVAARTGNLFAETKLVYDNPERGEGVGFMIKSKATFLFYFVEGLGCYILKMPELQQYMNTNIGSLRQASHRDYQGKNGEEPYTAYGYLIKLNTLPKEIIRQFMPISEYSQFVEEMNQLGI